MLNEVKVYIAGLQISPSQAIYWNKSGEAIYLYGWLVGWSFGRKAGLTPAPLRFRSNLHSQYTSDSKYAYISLKPFEITTAGSLQKFLPTTLTPPMRRGTKVFYGELLLKDYSDHQRVNYFWVLLTSNFTLAIHEESPNPPDSLPL